jgi:3-deoxy-D-manno-octulosonate 8-phosphate phosphatase (KDO 8-P phosphatase)
MDVDGVLTDSKIIYDEKGKEYKIFDVHDGYGIHRAVRSGLILAIISGRKSSAVAKRAKELGIKEVYQNVGDKKQILRKLAVKYKLKQQEICSIGDDEPDLPMLLASGVSAAPKSAVQSVREKVDIVTRNKGGRGSVREVLDFIHSAKQSRKR